MSENASCVDEPFELIDADSDLAKLLGGVGDQPYGGQHRDPPFGGGVRG